MGAGVGRARNPENRRGLSLDATGGEPRGRLVRTGLVRGGVVGAEKEIRPARGSAVEVLVLLARLPAAAAVVVRGGRGSPARLSVENLAVDYVRLKG